MKGSDQRLVRSGRRTCVDKSVRRRSATRFRKVWCSGYRLQPSQTQHPLERAQTCFEGPFGEVIRATGPMAKTNPFRFSTKYQDDETDLLYYGYRYYNASLGRWLTKDPIGERGALNLYCFLDNLPQARIDPNGLCCLPLAVQITHVDVATTEVRSPEVPIPGRPDLMRVLPGVTVHYSFVVLGDRQDCKCFYTDQGSAIYSSDTQHKTSYWFFAQVPPPVHPVPGCLDGEDHPGGDLLLPPMNQTWTYTVTYNWTGTVFISGMGRTLQASTSLTGAYQGRARF